MPCIDQWCTMTSWTTCSYPECNKVAMNVAKDVARNVAKDVARGGHEQPACQGILPIL